MKTMKTMKTIRQIGMLPVIATAILLTGCAKEEEEVPEEEHEMEVITDVKLIFTNDNDSNDIVYARAQDPDGDGVEDLKILDSVNLDVSKSYTLTFEIMNNLETPGEDIGLEIADEDDEHQIFFSFSNDAFSDPLGNGNIDNASDSINYNDVDGNGNPVGLSTGWTTASSTLTGGTFTVKLQHQPDVKTSTSTANTGDTDFELEFVLNIQ